MNILHFPEENKERESLLNPLRVVPLASGRACKLCDRNAFPLCQEPQKPLLGIAGDSPSRGRRSQSQIARDRAITVHEGPDPLYTSVKQASKSRGQNLVQIRVRHPLSIN